MKNLYLFAAAALMTCMGANAAENYDFIPTGGTVVDSNYLSVNPEGYTLLLDMDSDPAVDFDYDYTLIKLRSPFGNIEDFDIAYGVEYPYPNKIMMLSVSKVTLEADTEYSLLVPADLFGDEEWEMTEYVGGRANPYLQIVFTTTEIKDIRTAPVAGFNPAVTLTTTNYNMNDVPEVTMNWGGVIAYCDDDPFYAPIENGIAITTGGESVQGAGVEFGYYNNWVDIRAMITGLPVRDNKDYVFTIPERMFYDAVYNITEGKLGTYSDEIRVDFNTFDLYTKDLTLDFEPTASQFEMTTVVFKEYVSEEEVIETPVDGLMLSMSYSETPFSTPAYNMEELKELGFGLYNDATDEPVDCTTQFVNDGDDNVLNIFFSDLTIDPAAGGYSVRLPFNTIGTMAWWMSWAKSGRCNPDTVIPVSLSGVENVAADNHGGAEVVYNLNGVKVNADAIAPGIYVRVISGKATKVLVK